MDVFLAMTLFLAFLGLAIAHFAARRADDHIQQQARSEERVNLTTAKKKGNPLKSIAADPEEIIISPGE